ncbi:unnamed protein product [Larinioides sclopetarius]|uniref:Uncharacterized protein n=1 Tax=Larinioides sclopetarius TaxID=280406 RepID=A0AAV2B140_9ARAC
MTQPIRNTLCPQQLDGRESRNDSTSAVGVRYDVVCVTRVTNKATTKFLFLRKGGATGRGSSQTCAVPSNEVSDDIPSSQEIHAFRKDVASVLLSLITAL